MKLNIISFVKFVQGYKSSRNERLLLKNSLARGSLDTLHPGKSISVPSTPPGLGSK
jgi:hypothetical protein